ncbi:MAG: fimbria/pilus periplasmic chaperone [Burkholderiaceae bacterium]|nr:fimbria/pilus periplasmic chaperone [Burkholderiaceae bacterium]
MVNLLWSVDMKHLSKLLLSFFVQLLIALMFSASLAHAGTFSVSPVRIFLQPRDRATAITITNDGSTEVVLQADVYDWRQLPNGEDDLQLTEDLVVSPPIIKLAPGARQVVRLARLNVSPPTTQLTYRLITREIPEIAAAKQGVSVQIALALSMPVFVTPIGGKPAMSCSSPIKSPLGLSFTCRNESTTHAQVRSASVKRGATELARLENGGYYLAGTQRDLILPMGQVTPGDLELELSLDDGSTPTFALRLRP